MIHRFSPSWPCRVHAVMAGVALGAALIAAHPAQAQEADREPCPPKKVAGDGFSQTPSGLAITLDATRAQGAVNWDVRWRQRHRLWVTLSVANAGDADVDVLPALLLQAPGADRRAGVLVESASTIPPHATLTRRMTMYLPDDAKTAGFALNTRGPLASPLQVSLSVACSNGRFDPGEMDQAAAVVLNEALKLYIDDVAEPVVNPRQVLESARVLAAGAHDSGDVAWALRALMNSLQDTHSFFLPASEATAAAGQPQPQLQPQPQPQPLDADSPVAELRNDGLAYLRLSATGAATDPGRLARAEALHARVAALLARRPRGWIIDLRAHSGTDLWPELAALSPLLDTPAVGAFVDRQGSHPWIVDRGVARLAGEPALIDLQLGPEAPFNGPIALLLGPDTADVGEDIAVAFIGRPRTRSFGALTAGFPNSGMQVHPLSDGSMLGILETRVADRNGVLYRGPITPDEPLDPDSARADGPPREAVEWALSGRTPAR